MTESKLDKTLAGFEKTKQLFSQSTPGKVFAFIRNIIVAAYFLPLLTSAGLAVLKPSCVVTQEPFSVSGCHLLGVDMASAIEFYYTTHFAGFIGMILFILIIKAFFMIKFINVKVIKAKDND